MLGVIDLTILRNETAVFVDARKSGLSETSSVKDMDQHVGWGQGAPPPAPNNPHQQGAGYWMRSTMASDYEDTWLTTTHYPEPANQMASHPLQPPNQMLPPPAPHPQQVVYPQPQPQDQQPPPGMQAHPQHRSSYPHVQMPPAVPVPHMHMQPTVQIQPAPPPPQQQQIPQAPAPAQPQAQYIVLRPQYTLPHGVIPGQENTGQTSVVYVVEQGPAMQQAMGAPSSQHHPPQQQQNAPQMVYAAPGQHGFTQNAPVVLYSPQSHTTHTLIYAVAPQGVPNGAGGGLQSENVAMQLQPQQMVMVAQPPHHHQQQQQQHMHAPIPGQWLAAPLPPHLMPPPAAYGPGSHVQQQHGDTKQHQMAQSHPPTPAYTPMPSPAMGTSRTSTPGLPPSAPATLANHSPAMTHVSAVSSCSARSHNQPTMSQQKILPAPTVTTSSAHSQRPSVDYAAPPQQQHHQQQQSTAHDVHRSSQADGRGRHKWVVMAASDYEEYGWSDTQVLASSETHDHTQQVHVNIYTAPNEYQPPIAQMSVSAQAPPGSVHEIPPQYPLHPPSTASRTPTSLSPSASMEHLPSTYTHQNSGTSLVRMTSVSSNGSAAASPRLEVEPVSRRPSQTSINGTPTLTAPLSRPWEDTPAQAYSATTPHKTQPPVQNRWAGVHGRSSHLLASEYEDDWWATPPNCWRPTSSGAALANQNAPPSAPAMSPPRQQMPQSKQHQAAPVTSAVAHRERTVSSSTVSDGYFPPPPPPPPPPPQFQPAPTYCEPQQPPSTAQAGPHVPTGHPAQPAQPQYVVVPSQGVAPAGFVSHGPPQHQVFQPPPPPQQVYVSQPPTPTATQPSVIAYIAPQPPPAAQQAPAPTYAHPHPHPHAHSLASDYEDITWAVSRTFPPAPPPATVNSAGQWAPLQPAPAQHAPGAQNVQVGPNPPRQAYKPIQAALAPRPPVGGFMASDYGADFGPPQGGWGNPSAGQFAGVQPQPGMANGPPPTPDSAVYAGAYTGSADHRLALAGRFFITPTAMAVSPAGTDVSSSEDLSAAGDQRKGGAASGGEQRGKREAPEEEGVCTCNKKLKGGDGNAESLCPVHRPKKDGAKGGPKDKDGPRCCCNCGTDSTPTWRVHPVSEGWLCNACGIFYQRHGSDRPQHKIDRQSERQVRTKGKPMVAPGPVPPAPPVPMGMTMPMHVPTSLPQSL